MAPPPNNNEPHRDDNPREDREPRDPAAYPAQAPKAETLLREHFAQFSAEHSLTALETSILERTWTALEQRIRGAIEQESNSELVLQPLAGAVAASGAVTLLIRSRDPHTGEYRVPTLTAPAFFEGEATQPRYTLTSFHSHGIGLLITLPSLEVESDRLRIGLDYLLTPTAMQLDQDRFLARSSSSVIGSSLLSVVIGRSHRLPDIQSIARWHQPDGEATTYRVIETEGTRHFITIRPNDRSVPSGITEIETVHASAPSIDLPRFDRHGGKVALHFDEFHRQRGFLAIDPESIAAEYPNLKEVITTHLKGTFPGFRSDWNIDFNSAMRQENSTAILLSISDPTLDSFVPGFTTTSSVRDKGFSGLLLTMDIAPGEPTPERSKGLLGWIGEKFPAFRPPPRPVMRLDIIGPVLSDDAWQHHIRLLGSDPESSFFFPPLARAIELDLHRFTESPLQIAVHSIQPTRVTSDVSSSWDKIVFAIDHSLGTHIAEVVRERSFGLIPSLVPKIQQYFPLNRRQRN